MNDILTWDFIRDTDSKALYDLKDYFDKLGDVKELRINIHSHGGDVDEAIAMYYFIKSRDIRVWTHNLGVVDSCALLLYLAGTTRTAEPASRFLVHPLTNTHTRIPYYTMQDALYQLGEDIKRYALIVESECKNFKDINHYLKEETHVMSPKEAKKLGIVTE